MSIKTFAALALAVVVVACASGGGEPPVVKAPAAPRLQVTRAVIYKKIPAARLRQALGADKTVRAAALAPVVGNGMADLVAGALEDQFANTAPGRAFVAAPNDNLNAYVVHTEDDRDITVLSDYAHFAVGGCVKLFEPRNRRDGPRIVPASGCLR